jgi:[protein-PII] uridylyltransferase
VVREFCGHGIGKKFHEDPQVLHYGKAGTGPKLEPGMIFTIEPMINAGKAAIREMADGWTIVTKDRSLSAQWEHTVLVTETGYEVLTIPPAAARSLTGSSDELRRCRPARRGKGQPASTPATLRMQQRCPRPAPRTPCAGRCGTRETLARLRLPASLALAAVGGYGRGELFPASDIDLLILLPTETSKTTQEKLERLVSHFWDIGLEIGHSVRTIQECLNEAAQDITVQTALLEARLLTGNAKLFATFQKRLHGNLDPLVFSKPSDSSSRNATCASTKPLQPGAELQGVAGWPARPAGHLLGRQGRRLRQAGPNCRRAASSRRKAGDSPRPAKTT